MSVISLDTSASDAEYEADCKQVFGVLNSKPDRLFHIPFLGVEPAILPQEAISLLVQPTVAVSAAHDRVVALLAQVCNLNYAPQVPAIALILLQQSGWDEVKTYVALRRLIEASRQKTEFILKSTETDSASFSAAHAPLFILSRGMEAAFVRAVRTIVKGVFPALSTHLESLPPPPGVTLPLSGEASSLSHVSSSLAFKQVVSSFLCGIGSGFLPPQDAARMAEDCVTSTPLVLVTHLLALLSLASESLLKCEDMEQADRTLRLFASSAGHPAEELGLVTSYDSAALLQETKVMEEKILPSALPLLLRRYLQRQTDQQSGTPDAGWHNAGERVDTASLSLSSTKLDASDPHEPEQYTYTSRILSLTYNNETFVIPRKIVEESTDPKGLLLRPVSASPIFSSLLSLLPPRAHRMDWKQLYQYTASSSTPNSIFPSLSKSLHAVTNASGDRPLCIFLQVRVCGEQQSQDSYQSRPVFGFFCNSSNFNPKRDGWTTHVASSSCALFQLHPDVQPLHWTSPTGEYDGRAALPVVSQHSTFHPKRFLGLRSRADTQGYTALSIGGANVHNPAEVPCECVGCGSHFAMFTTQHQGGNGFGNKPLENCLFERVDHSDGKMDSVHAYASGQLLLDLGIGNTAGHAEEKPSLANIPLEILGIDVYALV